MLIRLFSIVGGAGSLLSHPEIITSLLACAKKTDLEWAQLNFLGFTSIQNLAIVLIVVTAHQLMVQEIESIQVILSLEYIE